MNNKVRILGAIPILLPVFAVNAANLSINDSVQDEITVAHDANWEGGVNNNGVAYSGYAAGSETVTGETASFSGAWIAPGAGSPQPGAGVIYITDENDPGLVSDIITSNWAGSGYPRTINVDVQSSHCYDNLGPLPAAFAGLGVPEPDGSIGIAGLFRDSTTGAPVSIPSNLTIQFVAAHVGPVLSKELTSSLGDPIDVVVEVRKKGEDEPTTYGFDIAYDYDNPCAVDSKVLVVDTVPAEWDVTEIDTTPIVPVLNCGGETTVGLVDVSRGGKVTKNCKSATHLEWMPETTSTINVIATTRGPKKNSLYAPTSCGALMVNDGAMALELDDNGDLVLVDGEPVIVAGPTPPICLAAVKDLDSSVGVVGDGSGDEDADGLEDYAEACEIGTDPCAADTDGDGHLDGADACPLRGDEGNGVDNTGCPIEV